MADTGEAPEMETEMMSDIELSSDSEVEDEEGDEVSLIVMKRPTKIERTVKDIEVGIEINEHSYPHNTLILGCRSFTKVRGLCHLHSPGASWQGQGVH